ncbi:acid--CoA ligase [Rhodococcus sp. ACS1]|uniref:acetate--CoA ligase family protein n=1 Tax=Rhodococcus TaxID=1827 RepID=UPI000BB1579D|nr:MULTISPECIES: acetate--CoA ligase family protein [Rhodococcus]PBC50842.1 acid--CoA ligase [Rhodococcus sp. ACS1]QSE83317.1 acetate--CoA ligase family protein [Rhodococcus koreensis]
MTTVVAESVTQLSAFSDPASVAVVGASADPAKWGYWLASGALIGEHRRRVHLVNRRTDTLLEHPCHPNLSALPEVPDLVALCVPAPFVSDVVDEALALGVRGFLGVTAGVPGEAELAARIRSAGARLVGTNSLGIYDSATDLSLAWGRFTPGPLAIISQSGQLGSELATLGARHGVGVSRFVSIGNQSDVTAAELLADLGNHDPTRVIALYLESFSDGESLFRTLRALRDTGRPTLLLTVGASAASTRLARSHTGSLTSAVDVVDAACRAAGVLRVSTPDELITVARAFLSTTVPVGNRVAIVGDSGGQCAIAADVTSASALTVPDFSPALAESIALQLPPGAASSNPVDLAGAGEQDLGSYASVVEHLLRADESDAVVLTGYFGCYARDAPTLAEREAAVAERIGRASAETGKPVVVHTMAPESRTAEALWRHGVPVFDTIDSAIRALSGLSRLRPQKQSNPTLSEPVPKDGLRAGYWAARELLTDLGVAFPDGAVVRTHEEAVDVAGRLRAPFVLKASWLEHKSEAGGVVVGIDGPEQLARTFQDMHSRLGDGDYVLEEQDTRAGTVEILVGARRDPDLGPVIVVGAGGTETEVLQDIGLESAPVGPDDALAMLERLRCMPLLRGWRGRPAVCVDGLVDVITRVSRLIAERPDIAEIELNPVRVAPDGALTVDALVVAAEPTPAP